MSTEGSVDEQVGTIARQTHRRVAEAVVHNSLEQSWSSNESNQFKAHYTINWWTDIEETAGFHALENSLTERHKTVLGNGIKSIKISDTQ